MDAPILSVGEEPQLLSLRETVLRGRSSRAEKMNLRKPSPTRVSRPWMLLRSALADNNFQSPPLYFQRDKPQ